MNLEKNFNFAPRCDTIYENDKANPFIVYNTNLKNMIQKRDSHKINTIADKDLDFMNLDKLKEINNTNRILPKKIMLPAHNSINFFDTDYMGQEPFQIQNDKTNHQHYFQNDNENVNEKMLKIYNNDLVIHNKNKADIKNNKNEQEVEDEDEDLKLIQEMLENQSDENFSIKKVNKNSNYYKNNIAVNKNHHETPKANNQNPFADNSDILMRNKTHFYQPEENMIKTNINPNNSFKSKFNQFNNGSYHLTDFYNIKKSYFNTIDVEKESDSNIKSKLKKNFEINNYNITSTPYDSSFSTNSTNYHNNASSNNINNHSSYFLSSTASDFNKPFHNENSINKNYFNLNNEKNDIHSLIPQYNINSNKNFNLTTISKDYVSNFNNTEKIFNFPSDTNMNAALSENLKVFPLDKIIKHANLNKIQSDCFDILFNSNKNAVVSAPTGSGKTLLFELAMSRVIRENYNSLQNIYYNKSFKMIYIGPIKSLCQEKFNEWRNKFSLLNLTVVEATGDSEYMNINRLSHANIIVITPEKFDSLTRKWKSYPILISSISLIMIDEVHLLNEEVRGGTLEAVITRIKLLSQSKLFQEKKSLLSSYRTIAISATIPNINELAEWLQVDHQGLRIYGDEYRPVKVERIVLGYNMAKNEFMFEKNLNFRLAELINKYSDDRPSLIFCQTQKGTVTAGLQLLEDISKLYSAPLDLKTKEGLNVIANAVKDKQLSNLIKNGIAFHNAGLSLEDRQIVEENFKKGLSKVFIYFLFLLKLLSYRLLINIIYYRQ